MGGKEEQGAGRRGDDGPGAAARASGDVASPRSFAKICKKA